MGRRGTLHGGEARESISVRGGGKRQTKRAFTGRERIEDIEGFANRLHSRRRAPASSNGGRWTKTRSFGEGALCARRTRRVKTEGDSQQQGGRRKRENHGGGSQKRGIAQRQHVKKTPDAEMLESPRGEIRDGKNRFEPQRIDRSRKVHAGDGVRSKPTRWQRTGKKKGRDFFIKGRGAHSRDKALRWRLHQSILWKKL